MRAYLVAALMIVLPATGWAAERALGFPVSGVVAEVKVKTGDAVQVGDVLAMLDPAPFAARKRAADAHVAATKIIFDQADLRLNQTRELFDALSTSAENVDLAQTAQARAKMNLETARKDAALAAWELEHATLKAPFAGTVSAVPGYPGQVINLNAETAKVVVINQP